MKKIISTVLQGLQGVHTFVCVKEEFEFFNYYKFMCATQPAPVYAILVNESELSGLPTVAHLSTKSPDLISAELGNFSSLEVEESLKNFLKLCY